MFIVFIRPFRNFGAVLLTFALLSPVFAQQSQARRPTQTKPKPASNPVKKPAAAKPKAETTPKPDPVAEKAQFEAAIATEKASEKAELLVKFLADHPKSEFKLRAEESLAGARAAIADERLTAGDVEAAVTLFKLAIDNAPKPYSDRLFSGVIATIPANLYGRGFKEQGVELAKLIENNVAADVNKLLLLSTFYLGSENGFEAKRIAEAAIKLDEKNSAAHQTLATAHRINFDLESAAASFAKAVELDPESTILKRSLADMKRAIGKTDEAEKIYRDILTVNEKDNQARTGLVLSLFELGKRTDAEAEMARALLEVPGNVVLLGGVAYWYASQKDGEKAVDFARRAIEKDPRYVWSHIALGRGLILQGKPVEAEQVLVAARKYGNFPTLQYEIASARLAAGFFRDAAEELSRSFEVIDGSVATNLGGRIEKRADSFTEAIALERRASIFLPAAADSSEDAARLKALVQLTDRLRADTKDALSIAAAAEAFANGSDNMSVHRKLYVADLLLQNDIAADEAAKLTASAIVDLDRSLDVPSPGAAVMASELYEARNVSFSRNDFLLVPDVPKATLNALMRGRVEETTGFALLRQGKPAEASVRFRRALSVLPKDSAWWRSATWNLGTSLVAEGNEKEGLDAMIASYAIDKPNVARYIFIEQLWIKVNGNRDGLQEKIGPSPLPNFTAAAKPEPTPESSPSPAKELTSATEEAGSKSVAVTEVTPIPAPSPETSPTPESETVKPTASPETSPTPDVSPSPEKSVETVKESPTPEVSPTPEETQTAQRKEDGSRTLPTETKPPTKSLFEPIVIEIPKSRKPNDEPKAAAGNEEKSTAEEPVSGAEPVRPRIVEGKAIVGELMPCEIGVSQDNVSLINSGGSVSMLVSIEQGEDVKLVTGSSNSPGDVEVVAQSDTPFVAGRSMFVIRSVSERAGLYQVTFKAPCGKKDVVVRVR